MKRLGAVAGTILAVAAPAAARTVELQRLTPAGFLADADNLTIKVTPPAAPGRQALMVVAAPGLDHETLRLGIFCSAYKVMLPVTAIVEMVASEASAPAPAPTLTLTVASARSSSRCVQIGELNVRCINKVSISGTADARPVAVSVERDASVGGFCEDIARGLGVVAREAAQQFIAAATADPASAPDAPPPSPAPIPPPS